LDACAQLTETLLKHCPHIKILTTSREALGILGEIQYRLPSLGLPDIQQTLERFREYESIRLFEERAQLAQANFSLTMENAASIAQSVPVSTASPGDRIGCGMSICFPPSKSAP
jgi:non-specific serine/threonine protein kinase